jgi:hypothetical protein
LAKIKERKIANACKVTTTKVKILMKYSWLFK